MQGPASGACMKLTKHRIDAAKWLPAHFTGGEIVPEIVILHDTAGRLEAGNSAVYLASKNTASASAHFVIELDGAITQLVATNRRANHAGQSSYHGRSGCNAFSIGIELVNPGRMSRQSDTMALTWWGQQLAVNLFGIREAETREHGRGLWMPYPEPQLAALTGLLEVLFAEIPGLSDITTHWYVSLGRKADTNPLFPLEQVRTRILGADDPADMAAEAVSHPAPVGAKAVRVVTPGDRLNLRRWPSFNPNVIGAIPDGTVLPVLRQGAFEGHLWLRVLYGGQEGWIVARYTALVIHAEP